MAKQFMYGTVLAYVGRRALYIYVVLVGVSMIRAWYSHCYIYTLELLIKSTYIAYHTLVISYISYI